ncbi:DUF748 domain-containing protein [Paraburkholderia sp. BR10954]|uniref:DUF748 domain-containing protein n=1 Tax=Paraburkholderia sp. BR10954 TaxID=3236995 RepID=UPI0034D185DD
MASLNKASLASSIQTVRAVAQSHRTRRILVGLLIFVVVIGLLGFFAAPPLIRHIASQQLSKQLDRPASIGRVALNPYTLRFEADNVHIGERGGAGDFVDISRLIVKPSWSSLFRGAPIVDEVQVDSPRFHLVRLDAQHFNFSDLIEKFANQPAKPNSKPTQFSVSNIRVENGQVKFDDRVLGTSHVIDQWKLGIPFIATLPSKTDIFVEPLLRARIDGDSQLAIDGRTKPFAASRESEVSLRFDDLDVPKLVSYAPSKLPVIVQSGKLSTDLKLNFVMANDTPSLRVAGTVDLNDVDVQDQGKAPFFAARAVHVAAASLEPLKSVYHFDDIRIDAPSASVARDKDGVLSVEHMFAPAPGKPAAKETADTNAKPKTAAAEKAAPPFDVAIKRFALNDGTVNVHDEAASRPVEAGLQNLAVTLTDFSTLASAPAHYTLNTNLKDGGGSLAADGTVGLAAKTASAKLDLKSLKLPPLQPYLDTATSAQVLDGALSATTNIDANWSKSPMALTVADTKLDMQKVKLAARGDKTPVISLAQGNVVVKQVDVAARTADVTSVDATGLAVDAQRLKDGTVNLNDLAGSHQQATERTAIHAAKKAQAEGPAWRYKIGELTLKDATAEFTDNMTAQPVKLSFTPVQLKVQQISDDLSRPLPVDLQATLNKKGTLGVKGDVTATPLKLAVKVNANQLDAAAFEPYFGSQLNASLASALLNANGDLSVSQAKSLKANFRGDMALVAVRLIDKATSDPFAGWGSLALTNLKADYDEHGGTVVDAGRVTFSKFYGRVLLDAQGKLNLKDVVAHEGGTTQSLTRNKSGSHPIPLTPEAVSEAVAASAPAAVAAASAAAPGKATTTPAATATAATPPQNPLKMHFGQLVLQQGRVTYTDNFVKPNYTANLVDIQGTIGAFGTETTTPAPVDVAAKLAANGPLTIRGTVNPLIAKPALDLTATAHDIELTNLTPYSAKYAGYPITKGKLNVDLHYQLANDQLNANNHLFIDQLTFGDHIDNDTATKLPVRFAISLLKNSRGEIDVNLPVSGSLSNPEFSIGGLIWHAVLNLLEKAVTAPFSLIAHAFGGNGEDLGYVEFEAGSATLTDADKQKLDTIVKALTDKPSIRMDLIGRVDPKVDEPPLRTRYVDQMVKRQKIKDAVGNGESVDPSTVTVDQKDYEKYLTKAYKSSDFKKPRNFIGMTKTLPDDDMKSALAANAPIDDASLRQLAQQRAQSVQQYLEGKIDSSRVFIVAPKMNPDDIKDKGATTRVDFGLK